MQIAAGSRFTNQMKVLILQLFFSEWRVSRCPIQVRTEQNRIQKKVELEGRAAKYGMKSPALSILNETPWLLK